MMWKSKFDAKRGQYDVQIKCADGKGRALCCINERVDATEGNMM